MVEITFFESTILVIMGSLIPLIGAGLKIIIRNQNSNSHKIHDISQAIIQAAIYDDSAMEHLHPDFKPKKSEIVRAALGEVNHGKK